MAPIIREMIEREGAGESKGGVGFAEVEFDAPTVGELGGRYAVCLFSVVPWGVCLGSWMRF